MNPLLVIEHYCRSIFKGSICLLFTQIPPIYKEAWSAFLSRGGGGVLPYKRLMGMSRWMRSLLHDWIDCNWVAFSIELLEWDSAFSDFLGYDSCSYLRSANVPECSYLT